METLPIEDAFINICNEKSDYAEFYHIYFATKCILQKNYYPFIKDVNPFYTDHGINHINRILHKLFRLLKPHLVLDEGTTPYTRKHINEDKTSKKLNAYELYLLMCSVLWHDVGNLYGRIKHENNIHHFFDKAKNFLHDKNSSEWIEKICEAHSGSNAIISKIDRESKNEKEFTFYPRFLAALLRFSDELDEDKQRIGERVIDLLPEGKQAFWFFCKCNDSIDVEDDDFQNRKIIIECKINRCELFQKLKKENTDGTGIEEVIGIKEYSKRINKINEERKYCTLYFKPHYFKTPDKIELRLSIYDVDNKTCLDKINFMYDDANGDNEFFKSNTGTLEKYRG